MFRVNIKDTKTTPMAFIGTNKTIFFRIRDSDFNANLKQMFVFSLRVVKIFHVRDTRKNFLKRISILNIRQKIY